jgi:shikimate kinase
VDAQLIQNKKTNVYIIGYMTVGKSTVGKKIANKLGFDFVDLDLIIEEELKFSIREIFEKKGEAFFRATESKTLIETKKYNNTVISCGGGTPCFNNNIDWMLKNGIVVYLHLPIAILLSRLWRHKANRPLISNMTKEQMETFVINQLTERAFYYEKAHYQFDIMRDNLDLLIKNIKEDAQKNF